MGGSLGGGQSKSQSEQSSVNRGSDVWQPQQNYLTDIWSQGQQQGSTAYGGASNLTQYNDQLAQANKTLQNSLNMIQNNGTNSALNAFNPSQPNPMLQVYADQIQNQFQNQIMPQLQSNAVQAGQLGSSRAGIAQGMAAAAAQQNLQNFGAQQYNADQDRALQAALAQQQSNQQNVSQAAAIGGAQGALAQNYGQLAQMNAVAPWFNLQNYAQLVGSPIMQDLGGESYGHSKSNAWNIQTEAHLW